MTQRCVPANKPMWKLDNTQDIVEAHRIWFDKRGHLGRGLSDLVKPGSVVVNDVGSTHDVGFFGSENVLGLQAAGAVGIVTNGQCRDSAEVTMQRTPMACRSRGRTIIPGPSKWSNLMPRLASAVPRCAQATLSGATTTG